MKKFLSLLLAMAMVMSLAACGSGSSSTTNDSSSESATASTDASSTEGDTAAEASTNDGNTAVVIGTTDGDYACYPPSSFDNDFMKQAMVYDKLFEVDDTTGEYGSRVLESWEWLDDVTLEMKLKDNITFSDGNQMTMEDVLYTMQCFIDGGMTTDKYVYFQYIDFDATTISDDGLTMDLVYTQPYGPGMRTLNMSILEKSFAEQYEETDDIWFTDPVGSGPYAITDYVADAYVTFTLRDDYWDSADYSYDATEITLKFYTDETAMLIDYQAGNLDVMYNVSSTVADQVAADSSLGTLQMYEDNNTVILIMNEDNEYLSDPVVREAICYAVDPEYITEVCYGSLGTVATDLWATTFECYSDHSSYYSYDPEYAKQLLADAGYSDGEIVIDWICPDIPPQTQIGECVQAFLSEIGIKMNVQSYELSTALGYHVDGTTAISNLTCNGGNPTCEPDQFISSFCGGATFSAFSVEEEEYNEYYNTGLNSTDEATRWEAYKNVSQWLYDNHIMLPLTENMTAVVYNSRIASFDQATVGRSCLGSLKLS
jgi:ABC-type transport system substrate-binding protein